MKRPCLHLICNAHLDPVWQWRWEEGAAEAIATFRTAAELLHEHPRLIFNHNEAILYMWVERYDPELFKEIRRLVRSGRWVIAGGWFLQPDVNLPGTESIIRQIEVGRRYFKEKFGVVPQVAYNFDSFGHSGGLPQVLRLAGYKMYIHMRPQAHELELPSDLYRWRGVDGTEMLCYRIAVGLYHTERDNMEQRLMEGTELALKLNRDVPVFWGLGNHGGGPTREDLRIIDEFILREKRVKIFHSTTDLLYEALKEDGENAPVFEGDLQRVFTGCYTSLSRVKRRARESLGCLVQAEALAATAWWLWGEKFPASDLADAWLDHLFNDFHDVITGSCVEPAEKDALDIYGRAVETSRRFRLAAAAAFNRTRGRGEKTVIPVTVMNTNPAATQVPVEVECMLDYRPARTGKRHLRLFRPDGAEILCQEEQAEPLLPFNRWRRKVCFMAGLPGVGFSSYELRVFEGERQAAKAKKGKPGLRYRFDPDSGLITSLLADPKIECLRGRFFEPLVIVDEGDSWGTDCWSYLREAGRFKLEKGSLRVIEEGPVRTITESLLAFNGSRIVFHTIAYNSWPVLEFRLRIHWHEERRMLKLVVPTVFRSDDILCEIPGGAIRRRADGEEHSQGRWLMVDGRVSGRRKALGVVNSGQHGLDFRDGEIRISVLRSAAYCHEKGFRVEKSPCRKFMDQGVHEVRLLVTAGKPEEVLSRLPGLADWLDSPPAMLAHLPPGLWGDGRTGRKKKDSFSATREEIEFLSVEPAEAVRLSACRASSDGKALFIRLVESAGTPKEVRLKLLLPAVEIPLAFKPFEIITLRIEKEGAWRVVSLTE